MIALGIDPGLHETAWAIVEVTHPKILEAGCYDLGGALSVKDLGLWRGTKGLQGQAAMLDMVSAIDVGMIVLNSISKIVVESQQVYEGSQRKGKPEDLIRLATISGACLFALTEGRCSPVGVHNPLPREWKGNVEKSVPQARACLRLGWKYRLAGGKDPAKQWVVPAEVPVIGAMLRQHKDAEWKNIMDAIALAIWGLQQ